MKKALILALLTVLTATGYAQTTKFAMTIGTDLGLAGKNYKIVTPNVSATYDLTPKLSEGRRRHHPGKDTRYQDLRLPCDAWRTGKL